MTAWPSRDVHLLSIKRALQEAKTEQQYKKLEHRIKKIETVTIKNEFFLIITVHRSFFF